VTVRPEISALLSDFPVLLSAWISQCPFLLQWNGIAAATKRWTREEERENAGNN